MNIKDIEHRIRSKQAWKHARQAVPGEGPSNASIMLVGQNPGEREDKEGRPFVGRTGKYLNDVLEKNSIARAEIYITSVVKYKTPGNRKPTKEEIKKSLPILMEQIEAVKPDLIVLMGEVAKEVPRLEGIHYIETVHPTAAMRFPKMREKFEEDIQKVSYIF